MLYMIGLGLDDGEITQKGLEALEQVDNAFVEFYTNTETTDIETLEQETGTEIEVLEREEVEQEDRIVESAREEDTAFLVSGDPLTATTHYDIKHRAEQEDIKVEVIHAPSVLTSIADTGLNVYKFGRVVTLPEDSAPDSVAEHIVENDSVGLHTLVLLDINYAADEAAEKLVELGVDSDRQAVVMERANQSSQWITVAELSEITGSKFGKPPHSIIITGETSHKEEEFLEEHR